MQRQEWIAGHLGDATGSLPGRSSGTSNGVDDLMTLAELADGFGRGLDRDIADGVVRLVTTSPALMRAVDPTGRLGRVARERIDTAHDIQLAGTIVVCEPLFFGDVQPPAGVGVTTWTSSTTLPIGTPGVAIHADGSRTRTHLFCAAVGGEDRTSYNLPFLIEAANDPTDVRALAVQALDLGLRGRELILRYVPTVAGVRIGSLPVLLGRIRPAGPHPVLGGIFGDPVAIGDLPEIIDAIDELTCMGIPVVVQACYGADGKLRAPQGWWLDLTPRAGADTERPGSLAGVAGKIVSDIPSTLLGKESTSSRQVLVPVPDVAGQAWRTRGSMMAQGNRGAVMLTAIGHLSSKGRPSIGLTNLPPSDRGNMRLSLALEGLFGSADARAVCRRRAASMISRIDVPTRSPLSASRVSGIVVMAYRGTVLDRVGTLSR